MRGRGKAKAVEVSNGKNNNYSDHNYSSSDLPCRKHPFSSPVGICAYCLNERLMELVCSDCGDRRLSSCSCSDVSSSCRNSCSTVGRISFLIENEKTHVPKLKSKRGDRERSNEDSIMLKRSSSICNEVERSKGLGRIGKFFRKNRGKQSGGGFDEKSDMWESDYMGVSRSRSLCSFRANTFNGIDHEGSEFAFSSAKISDVNEAEPRRSGLSRVTLSDSENGVGLKEVDVCDSKFPNKLIFPEKENEFSGMDESGFIDLKLDLSSELSKTDYSALKMSDDCLSISVSEHYECRRDFGSLKEDRVFGHGGSCRITANEKRIDKGSKGNKVWRWIFSHNHHGWRSAFKKDGDYVSEL